jgi:Tat protein secretion system quality control protein TatD with DNase activity
MAAGWPLACIPSTWRAIWMNLHMLEQHLQQHAPVAVGEIGLDFYVPGLDAARQEPCWWNS